MNRGKRVSGAMGLASWRVRAALDEYELGRAASGAHVAVSSKTLTAGTHIDPLTLNEVGVTDGAVSVLWMFGPRSVAQSVSAPAENQYLGADIAFVDHRAKRLLVYQAKLASWNGVEFVLKSPVTLPQVQLLSASSVGLGGVNYDMSGRVALYQNHVDFGHWVPNSFAGWRATSLGGLTGALPSPKAARALGANYYKSVLSGSYPWSPCGVLDAPISPSATKPHAAPVKMVSQGSVSPWEFAFQDWWAAGLPRRGPRADPVPDREPGQIAAELREVLRLPEDHALFVTEL